MSSRCSPLRQPGGRKGYNDTYTPNSNLPSADVLKFERFYNLLFGKELTLSCIIPSFNNTEKERFENIVEKEDNACDQFIFFSLSVFYLVKEKYNYLKNTVIVVCNYMVKDFWI